MTRQDFFTSVLATEGYYCIICLKQDAPALQRFFSELSPALAFADEQAKAGRNAFFGCAKYESNYYGRNAKNAKWFKSFWLDLDCGAEKPYKTKAEGYEALKKFCQEQHLPKPSIVDSGRGYHCYWALEEPIEYNLWRPVADTLKELCPNVGFLVDPSRTNDAASVLRVPDTLNYKENPALAVKLVHIGTPITLEQFQQALGHIDHTKVPGSAMRPMDPVTQACARNNIHKFSKIMKLSAEEEEIVREVEELITNKDGSSSIKLVKQKQKVSKGCAQLLHIFLNQNEIEEPLWRAGLSIANKCIDRDTAIHKLSNRHAEYDPRETEKKAARTGGPQKCTTFQKLNPSLCITCPKKGKLSTPLQLGTEIAAATPEDNQLDGIWHSGLKEYINIEVPPFPFPWFRGRTGGVYVKGSASGEEELADEEAEGVLIYEHDLWVKSRMQDQNYGEVLLINLILPKDGLIEFTMPLAHLMSKDKCREILAAHGVAAMDKKMDNIRAYINKWAAILQHRSAADKARMQFGWHDNDSRFVIGTREITEDGEIVYNAPSSSTVEIASLYTQKGSLENWLQVVAPYNNPGNEARALGLFMSFGSPLYKFFGVGSMIIHLTNSASGVGKSTIQMVACSVWGHPIHTMLNENDKVLAREHRFGVLKNIIPCIDEITNIDPEEASDTIFRFSFGRGRNRMHSQINAERKNYTSWETVGLTSGNNSLYDVLRANKAFPEGELLRVLEIEVQRDEKLSKEESDRLYNQLLLDNYGIAGEIYMKYVVTHLDEVKEQLRTTQKTFDERAGFTQKERFYSAALASAFTGAAIAHKLGLHNIDVERVKAWAISIVGKKEVEKEEPKTQWMEAIGRFINAHNRNVLVINGNIRANEMLSAPIREPFGELIVRYEPDTRELSIAHSVLQKWCADNRVPFAPLKTELEAAGALRSQGPKRLGKGTHISGAPVWSLVLDANKLEGVDELQRETY